MSNDINTIHVGKRTLAKHFETKSLINFTTIKADRTKNNKRPIETNIL